MNYDDWRGQLSRCDCCHKNKYDCEDVEYEGESWHICPSCAEKESPLEAYVDPDNLREERAEARWGDNDGE